MSTPYREGDSFILYLGDCLEVLKTLPDCSVDAVVTDPPYGINFMGKAWDGKAIQEAIGDDRDWSQMGGPTGRDNTTHSERGGSMHAGLYDLSPRGMRGFQVWTQAWASEAMRILKPGGHLLSFASPRTYHRMVCGIEEAGFEIRDCLAWMFGSGFPKSMDVSKAIDKAAGAEREIVGREDRRGAYDGATRDSTSQSEVGYGSIADRGLVDVTAPATEDAERWQGWGTALKPAYEPIVLARKPLAGTVAANVLAHGTGAINVDACRIGTDATIRKRTDSDFGLVNDDGWTPTPGENGSDAGRWPANVILDDAWEPIMRLRYTLEDDLWLVLSDWCHARRNGVSAMQGNLRRAALTSEAPEVLLSSVPPPVDEREPARRSASDVRAQAHGVVNRQDVISTERKGSDREQVTELEGGQVQDARLLDGEPFSTRSARPRTSETNGDEGTHVSSRASAGDGPATQPPTDKERDSASHQRDQDRQQAGELRGSRSKDAPNDPRRSLPRAQDAARPSVEVLLRDIPASWLSFFDFTGDVANVGSAAMLDEQSGTLHSQDPATRNSGNKPGWSPPGTDRPVIEKQNSNGGDAGGASRFFFTARPSSAEGQDSLPIEQGAERFHYCAKVSRAERNAGCDGMEDAGMSDDGYGSIQTPKLDRATPRENWTPRPVKNNHPTVKPIDLMRWLIRLVTPPNGTVLDPFLGSGSTGCAAVLEPNVGRFIGIEREEPYMEIADARITFWHTHGEAALDYAKKTEKRDKEEADSGQISLLGEDSSLP